MQSLNSSEQESTSSIRTILFDTIDSDTYINVYFFIFNIFNSLLKKNYESLIF